MQDPCSHKDRKLIPSRGESWCKQPLKSILKKGSKAAVDQGMKGFQATDQRASGRQPTLDEQMGVDIPLCPVGIESSSGQRSLTGTPVKVTMDSGCGKSVIGKKLIAGHSISPSPGSKAKQNFVGPGGERYPNEGQVRVPMVNENGQPCHGNYQVTEALTKPLAAISDSCDKGNIALFDNDGSFLIRRDSGEGKAIRELARKAKDKMNMYRENGVYVMPMWIQPAGTEFFPRQGR